MASAGCAVVAAKAVDCGPAVAHRKCDTEILSPGGILSLPSLFGDIGICNPKFLDPTPGLDGGDEPTR